MSYLAQTPNLTPVILYSAECVDGVAIAIRGSEILRSLLLETAIDIEPSHPAFSVPHSLNELSNIEPAQHHRG